MSRRQTVSGSSSRLTGGFLRVPSNRNRRLDGGMRGVADELEVFEGVIEDACRLVLEE